MNCPVAVKMIDLDHFERNQIDELRREIQVMTLCKHPNLLRIYASFVNTSKLWIVTPYLSGGSCLDIMKTGFRDGLEEVVIATILGQALQGLEYLHKNGHIHRDVKAGNLLIGADGTVQLADFGVSSSLMEDMERRGVRKTFVGTPCWMAPEVMEMTNGYDVKADMWSFGITALELAYGHAPFAKYPPMKVIYLTLSSAPPHLDRKRCKHKYSKMFKEMIELCLQKDASKRPSAEQLLKHPFFKLAKKKAYLSTTILSVLPPLEQRPRVMKLVKQCSNGNEYADVHLTDWDFSETSGSEADLAQPEATAVIETLSISDDEADASDTIVESNESTVPTSAGDKKSSRFVVEPQSSNPDSTAPSPKDTDKDDGRRTCPTATDSSAENGEDSGIKKGRFSVLESASPNTSDESSSKRIDPSSAAAGSSTGPVLIEGGDTEDGRRSRFQVESSMSANNLPHTGGDNLTQTASPAQGSRFHVTQTEGDLPRDRSQDSIPAPFPRGMDFRSEILYEGEDLHENSASTDYSREYGHHPMGSIPFNHGLPPPLPHHHHHHHHRVAPIFVHPSQLDQLMLLNELIRQQLLELRNLSGTKRFEYGVPFGASSSYQGTVHGGDQYYGGEASHWDRSFRGSGMVEDPHIGIPTSYSAYPSGTVNSPENYHHWPGQGHEARPMGFPKRRSISIDHRHFQPSSNMPPPPSGLQQSHRIPTDSNASSQSTHRPAQSLKSPASTGSNPATDPFSTLDSLKRELEYLKRENEQLRKH